MTFYTFGNGTLADANQVNNNLDFLSKQHVIARYNHEKTSAETNDISDEGFVYDFLNVNDVSDLSYLNTGSSAIYHTEQGYVGFCNILDLFNDSSFDLTIWGSSTSGTGTATVSEDSEKVRVRSFANGDNDESADASIISDGVSGFETWGSDAELLVSYSYSLTDISGGPSASMSVQLTDGTNHVNLHNVANTSTSNNHNLRIGYDSSGSSAYTSFNGAAYGNSIDVSSLSGSVYLRFTTSATSNSNGDDGAALIDIYGVGYQKNGDATGSSVFVSPVSDISDSTSLFVYPHFEQNNSPPNILINSSLDAGSSYSGSDNNSVWDDSISGSELVFKMSGSHTTSITTDGSTKHIPVLLGWGVLHN